MRPLPPFTRIGRRTRGVALIEALVALLVMSFGMVALVGLLGQMRRSADLARQRGEALRIAQQQMETLRDFSVIAAPVAGQLDYTTDIASIASDTTASVALSSNANYVLKQTVTGLNEGTAKAVRIEIDWLDRASVGNNYQYVILDTFIAGEDPSLGGTLTFAPVVTPTRRLPGGGSTLPFGAKDIGNQQSVLKPQAGGTVAWVFNNLTGLITSTCTVVNTSSTSTLQATDLTSQNCSSTAGFYLGGYVRFSATIPPVSDFPSSSALPVNMVLVADVADAAGDPVPVSPSSQCFDDAPTSAGTAQTVVTYNCIVYPNTTATINGVTGTPVWSARLTTSGIPTGPGNWSLCRYSDDYDGNGTITNNEHPLDYINVAGSLTNQNFLVILASQTCPAGHAANPAGGVLSDTVTVLMPNPPS